MAASEWGDRAAGRVAPARTARPEWVVPARGRVRWGGSGMGGAGPGAPDRTLYVGNLPYDCSQQDIETLINGVAAGQVVRVHLPMDPDGRKRGFGFVTMSSPETAKAASEALKTADMRGRRLIINLAHPKGSAPRGPRGGSAVVVAAARAVAEGGRIQAAVAVAAAAVAAAPEPVRRVRPPQRKTFDDRRRRHTNNNEDGPRKRRFVS